MSDTNILKSGMVTRSQMPAKTDMKLKQVCESLTSRVHLLDKQLAESKKEFKSTKEAKRESKKLQKTQMRVLVKDYNNKRSK